ncbi:MAG: penicillin-binding protein activator [Litoreibacter sp.]|nr:penicillin-binding protein activator [Litoreibacter sp.]
MINIFARTRKRIEATLRRLGLLTAVALLAGCNVDIGGGTPVSEDRPVKVALLVPYGSATPGDGVLAASLENAARLAAADLGGGVEITVYPTAGAAETAALAASQAVDEGADIILGPLRSDAAAAAAVQTRRTGVNVLAFSNNSQVAGGNLFVLGNTFDTISDRLVSFATAQGRSRIAVVYPETTVGRISYNAIARAAARAGASLVGESSFEFSQQGIIAAIPAMAATVNGSGANTLMLTSDSTGALPILAQLLPENGVDPELIKYMGLSRWDVPVETMSYPGLQGGWFALPDPDLVARFNARYESTYGEPPAALAGLAYDGIAAVGALAAEGLAPTTGNLMQGSGFAGVNGVFRFNPDGTNERALAVVQIANSQVEIIDPAPKFFGTGGF